MSIFQSKISRSDGGGNGNINAIVVWSPLQMCKRRRQPKRDYNKYLPEELWFEIFLRLPQIESIYKYRCLGESAAGFVYYCQCEKGELSVWLLDQDCLSRGWNWRLVHKMKVKEMLPESSRDIIVILLLKFKHIDTVNLKPLGINPLDPDVVFLRNNARGIFAYDMRTRRLKVLRSPEGSTLTPCGRDKLLPFVLVTWPTKL